MKYLKIGLVGLGFAMLLIAVSVAFVGNPAQAEMSGVGVKVSNGEVAVNVPTDTALTAFDRFLDRFLTPKEERDVVAAPIFGAIASPDIQSPYISINGVRTSSYGRSETFIQSSTTLCSFEAPAATSTVANRNVSIYFEIASSTQATLLSVVRSQSPSGISTSTDTQIGNDIIIDTTGNLLVQASTTGITTNVGLSNLLFSSWILNSATSSDYQKEYLVFMLTGGEGTGQYTPTGHCQVDGFLEL